METSTDYVNNVNIVKESSPYTKLNETQRKYEEQLVTQQQIEFLAEADKILNEEKENELTKAIKEMKITEELIAK